MRATHPQVKVIYMSGYTDRTVPLDGHHGDAFLQKPFTAMQLHSRIREVLSTF
jgi:two-component SAPR family response regulator